MTAILSPASFAQLQGDLGQAYVFATEMIRMEIAERASILPFVEFIGDLAGTGSDVVRVTRMGGAGFAEAMTAMTSETDPNVATGFTTGYDTATIARYGLAKEETYQGRILTREEGVTLDKLVQLVPNSWEKTMRVLALTAATGITDVEGTSGAAWSFDNEINLSLAFNEIPGFEGQAFTFRHPEQYSDLMRSLRNEPAYQFPEAQRQLQGIRAGGGAVDFMGFVNRASVDVQTSGGDHIGAAFAPGALGWVRAGTNDAPVDDPASAIILPEYGLVIERESSGKTARARYDANAWIGAALRDPSLAPQIRIRSIND